MKNKKILSLCPLFIFCSLSLHPLESRFTGLGIEANVHTREGIAAGSGLAFGFDLNRGFALGCKAAISYNFDTVAAIEPLVFFRYYLPFRFDGPFAQAEAGAVIYFEHGAAYPAFSGGPALGWRFILGKNIYLEPLIRGGYPFAWGAGLTAGIIKHKNI